jgi:hypothetical protein
MTAAPVAFEWIRPLAAPYLRGYRAVVQRSDVLRGYWFVHPAAVRPADGGAPVGGSRAASIGFFAGYLFGTGGHESLDPQPPECLVFAFVTPVVGSMHRRLVVDPESLLRRTFTYIRWLTHRPPRFVFQEKSEAVMVRHQSMRVWERDKYQHFSRNFFIETLAWLVRSGLVREFLADQAVSARLRTKRSKKVQKRDSKKPARARRRN